MNQPAVTLPSERVLRLYNSLVNRFGPPDDMHVFDPVEHPSPPAFLRLTHVPVWTANHFLPGSLFLSLGLSDRPQPGTTASVEVAMLIGANLSSTQKQQVAKLIANIAAYPFEFNKPLQLWNVIREPGAIPEFTACSHVLLGPCPYADEFNLLTDPDGDVQLLHIIPITRVERRILEDHGREAFADYVNENDIDLTCNRRENDWPGAGPEVG